MEKNEGGVFVIWTRPMIDLHNNSREVPMEKKGLAAFIERQSQQRKAAKAISAATDTVEKMRQNQIRRKANSIGDCGAYVSVPDISFGNRTLTSICRTDNSENS